jgi:hypothetical protein
MLLIILRSIEEPGDTSFALGTCFAPGELKEFPGRYVEIFEIPQVLYVIRGAYQVALDAGARFSLELDFFRKAADF